MKRVIVGLVVLVLLGGLVTVLALPYMGVGDLGVQSAWARTGTFGGNSAVYFVINGGSDDDILLSADSNAAMRVELHASSMGADGTMTMQHQDSVPVPAGQRVEFKPGGLHVMMMNLTSNFEAGEKVRVTLNFEKAGPVLVEAEVREP